jgi:hypothetical protein
MQVHLLTPKLDTPRSEGWPKRGTWLQPPARCWLNRPCSKEIRPNFTRQMGPKSISRALWQSGLQTIVLHIKKQSRIPLSKMALRDARFRLEQQRRLGTAGIFVHAAAKDRKQRPREDSSHPHQCYSVADLASNPERTSAASMDGRCDDTARRCGKFCEGATRDLQLPSSVYIISCFRGYSTGPSQVCQNTPGSTTH